MKPFYLFIFFMTLLFSSCEQKPEDPIDKYIKNFTKIETSFSPLSYVMNGYTDIKNERNFILFKAETNLKLKIKAEVRAKFKIDDIKVSKKNDEIEYTIPPAEIEIPNILEYKYVAYKKNLLSPKITRAEMMNAVYSMDNAKGIFLTKAKNAKIDEAATNQLKDFLIANAASYGIPANKISFKQI